MFRVVQGARARSNGVKLREGKCRLDLRKLPAGGDLFNCEIVSQVKEWKPHHLRYLEERR